MAGVAGGEGAIYLWAKLPVRVIPDVVFAAAHIATPNGSIFGKG